MKIPKKLAKEYDELKAIIPRCRQITQSDAHSVQKEGIIVFTTGHEPWMTFKGWERCCIDIDEVTASYANLYLVTDSGRKIIKRHYLKSDKILLLKGN